MKRTVTTYSCDACGTVVDRPRDLRQFTLVGTSSGGRNRYRDAPKTEVCDPCEAKLLDAFGAFIAETQAENLVDLRRPPLATTG